MTDKFVIAKIEREHEFLLSELDRFSASMPNPKSTDELGCNCTPEAAAVYQNQLDDFSMTFICMMQHHFADEERLMRAPRAQREIHAIFESHKEAHANMAEKMANALGAATSQQQRAEILDLITHWLTEHIDTHDKVLIDWVTGSIE